ncbi:hypothetical protein ALP08_02082 [Pseudomonas syringae pv. pisi]|uniref:Uncharacterized protein n=1 Tax=Pseudomonas syringae pv. pisi TaxID=59510 RepID=A0A3M6DIR9_PSESJ|nr:hypothetical protein ALQ44_01727 [Pseudomonas syringae pv. pisi]RMV55830.1 hypothetical protein ALP08_02082 [Pseudomonas syringae pv. pisi]
MVQQLDAVKRRGDEILLLRDDAHGLIGALYVVYGAGPAHLMLLLSPRR